ncbi:endonuclease III [Candidatus Uhrbacteria bacterium]|nr:endonuclease III [Candidatus Uhrbacteria bacterium]MBI4598579.1 endonuclease III [Candidatus Uhrbacteria bacterium]
MTSAVPAVDIASVLRILRQRFGYPGAMELGNPYHTVVAVALSARTRDDQVLKRLPEFFKAFPTPEFLAQASVADIEARVDTLGTYRQKARNLKRMAADIRDRFDGHVPSTMDELVILAGVGRKTASVVLASCFGQPTVAVDTHVHRVTNRLGWVRTRTPEKTEQTLLGLVPKRLQTVVNRVFVKFGRAICVPGRPRCWMCPVRDLCRFPGKVLVSPPRAKEIGEAALRREGEIEETRQEVDRGLSAHLLAVSSKKRLSS